jgi:predicted amino acid racemase
MGKQDLFVDALSPRDSKMTMVAASSDHTVLDVTEVEPPVRIGDEIIFDMNYAGVATAMGRLDLMQVPKSPVRLPLPLGAAHSEGAICR